MKYFLANTDKMIDIYYEFEDACIFVIY